MQHAERFTVVDAHTDAHACDAILVHYASNFQTGNLGGHHTVFDHHLRPGFAEQFGEREICGLRR